MATLILCRLTMAELIEAEFGRFEDATRREYSPESILAATTAYVRVSDVHTEQGSGGSDMSWVPLAVEWPNDDEPEECW